MRIIDTLDHYWLWGHTFFFLYFKKKTIIVRDKNIWNGDMELIVQIRLEVGVSFYSLLIHGKLMNKKSCYVILNGEKKKI